jgi:hypothetical protein
MCGSAVLSGAAPAEFAPVVESLKRARELAIETLRWAATFPFPELTRDYEFVALRHPNEYPMNAGRIVSPAGLDIAASDYESEFLERQVAYSTALKRRGAYLVGALVRYALNRDCLPPEVRALADEAGRAAAGKNRRGVNALTRCCPVGALCSHRAIATRGATRRGRRCIRSN